MLRAFTFAASASLGVAALDVGVAMVPWSEHWRTALAALRVTPLVLAAAFVGLLVAAGLLFLLNRFLKRAPEDLFGAAGVSALLLFGILRYFDLLSRGALFGKSLWKPVIAIALGLVALWILSRWPPSSVRLEFAGLVIAAVVSFVWVFVYGLAGYGLALRSATLVIGLVGLFWLWRRSSAWSLRFSSAVILSLWTATLAGGWIAAEHPRAFFLPVSQPALTAPQGLPPILLLSIDTLRKDSLSFYNPSAGPTPNLDALAGDSVVFTNAMSAGSWTLPSVTSFMTGLAAREHRRNRTDWRLQENLPRLAQSLSDAGYCLSRRSRRNVLGERRLGAWPRLLRYGRICSFGREASPRDVGTGSTRTPSSNARFHRACASYGSGFRGTSARSVRARRFPS